MLIWKVDYRKPRLERNHRLVCPLNIPSLQDYKSAKSMFPSSLARHKIQMIDDHRQTKQMSYSTEHSACTNGRILSLSRSLITHQLTIALLLLQHYLLFLPFFSLLASRFSCVFYPRSRAEPCFYSPTASPLSQIKKLRIGACYATEMETSHMGQKTECNWV